MMTMGPWGWREEEREGGEAKLDGEGTSLLPSGLIRAALSQRGPEVRAKTHAGSRQSRVTECVCPDECVRESESQSPDRRGQRRSVHI